MYKDLIQDPSIFDTTAPTTIMPAPGDEDYALGHIQRYFVRKANDKNAVVYEVSQATLKVYEKKTFWKTCSIRWRVIGTSQEIRNSNTAAIGMVVKEFPSLPLYIPNLLQFSRKSD